jgi:urea transporter
LKQAVDIIFPPIEHGKLPFYRVVLRSISSLAFQSNELTGLLFLIAALAVSPISAAYLLTAAIIGPLIRKLLGEKKDVLASGLPGLNPALLALSLPAFFVTGWTNIGMWIVLLVCIVIAVFLVLLFLRIFPFPIIGLPFLIIFWVLWALEPHLSFLEVSKLGIVPYHTFHPVVAVLFGLGQAIFCPSLWSGLLFLVGLFLSNWRYAVIALCGSIIGTIIALYYGHIAPEGVNLGFYGLNSVLGAIAVYVICGQKIRLSILAALLSAIFIPIIGSLGVQTLAAPFILSTWIILALGWVEDIWFKMPQS